MKLLPISTYNGGDAGWICPSTVTRVEMAGASVHIEYRTATGIKQATSPYKYDADQYVKHILNQGEG